MAEITKGLAKGIVRLIGLLVIMGCLVRTREAVARNIESEVVFPGIVSGVPSIAVDRMNKPHIISYEGNNHDLLYAYRNGGSWENETVDSEGRVGDGHDIAIDQDGIPWITYRDWDSGALKYARKINGVWQVWFTSLGYQMAGPWNLGVSGTPVAADFERPVRTIGGQA